MNLTRRTLTKALGAAALGSCAPRELALAKTAPQALPDRTQFEASRFQTSLNNARWHPLSRGAQATIEQYLDYKRRGVWHPPDLVTAMQQHVREEFAALVHADADEIAFVPSTTAGENLLVASLGFPSRKGNIVTDALHFEGSLYFYKALERLGVDVRVVQVSGWGIALDAMAAVIDANTRLVAVSQVSFVNGFQHALAPLCKLAHTYGALVYADAVQAAGCIPVDVHASGVDAMATASYKWLMGDMGLGFLYVRKDVLPQLHRTVYGYRQLSRYTRHIFPWDTAGPFPVEYSADETTAGHFEIGTYANPVIAALSFSLPWLRAIGIESIQSHAQQLIARLRREMAALGYHCLTPEASHAPIVAFRVEDSERVAQRLGRAKVDVGLSEGILRASPSVYNTMEDVDRLLNALDARRG